VLLLIAAKRPIAKRETAPGKNQDSKKRAVTIVTIGQPVFAYFSVIGKGIE